MLSKEKLLRPRIRVTGKYPHSPFEIGNVLELKHDGKKWFYQYAEFDGIVTLTMDEFKEYPAIFELVPWWFARTVEDMPEYVESNEGGYYKVLEWFIDADGMGLLLPDNHQREIGCDPLFFQPATKEQYESRSLKS